MTAENSLLFFTIFMNIFSKLTSKFFLNKTTFTYFENNSKFVPIFTLERLYLISTSKQVTNYNRRIKNCKKKLGSCTEPTNELDSQ